MFCRRPFFVLRFPRVVCSLPLDAIVLLLLWAVVSEFFASCRVVSSLRSLVSGLGWLGLLRSAVFRFFAVSISSAGVCVSCSILFRFLVLQCSLCLYLTVLSYVTEFLTGSAGACLVACVGAPSVRRAHVCVAAPTCVVIVRCASRKNHHWGRCSASLCIVSRDCFVLLVLF